LHAVEDIILTNKHTAQHCSSQDHQRCGQATFDTLASFFPSLPLAADELGTSGVLPWRVTQFYMFALSQPYITHFVELSDALMAHKVRGERMSIYYLKEKLQQRKINHESWENKTNIHAI
jgi:hypothetical protein